MPGWWSGRWLGWRRSRARRGGERLSRPRRSRGRQRGAEQRGRSNYKVPRLLAGPDHELRDRLAGHDASGGLRPRAPYVIPEKPCAYRSWRRIERTAENRPRYRPVAERSLQCIDVEAGRRSLRNAGDKGYASGATRYDLHNGGDAEKSWPIPIVWYSMGSASRSTCCYHTSMLYRLSQGAAPRRYRVWRGRRQLPGIGIAQLHSTVVQSFLGAWHDHVFCPLRDRQRYAMIAQFLIKNSGVGRES